MLEILNHFRSKSDIKDVSFCVKERKVHLLVQLKKGKSKLAISEDGLEFKSQKSPEATTTDFLKNQKRKQAEQHLYHSVLASGSERMNGNNLVVERVIKAKEGVLVFYHHNQDGNIEVGVLMTEFSDPGKVIWKHSEPVWESPNSWRNKKKVFIDLIKTDKRYIAYWWLKGKGLFAIAYPEYKINNRIQLKQNHSLYKVDNNPLIAPQAKNSWEAFTTFNPAAIYAANKVHILYRAQGFDYVSVLGYASSDDGIQITAKEDKPAYVPIRPFEKRRKGKMLVTKYQSGGGCEGCEDPRTTRLGDKVYMTYVAFNGYDPPRIALTSIKLTDFLAKRWLWEKPVLISPPGVVDKSACILPEKINGKYVIFHRIFPNILIDYVDSLEFGEGQYLKGEHKIEPRSPMWWDSRKIGVGAPPIKTKDGWLLIYQAVDDKDSSHYKVGAMLLDINDPAKVLYRSRYPIIEPEEWYENEGFKTGVVYPCGAVIIKDQLFVYYGGADSHVCVATANLDQFLEKLKNGSKNKLESTYLENIV